MVGPVCLAVDAHRASAANAFAAIGVKGDRILALLQEAVVHDVEHFEKGGIRRNVSRLRSHEFALGFAVFLPPNLELEVHL